MLAAIDVAYVRDNGFASVMLFNSWADENPVEEKIARLTYLPKYVPGQFYKRELPILLAAVKVMGPVEMIVLDGYVWLDGDGEKGVGAHLFDALEGKVPVIGVAKTLFTGGPGLPVLRGTSARPLFITSVGIAAPEAVTLIQGMHGTNRIPTLLKRGETAARKAAGLKAT